MTGVRQMARLGVRSAWPVLLGAPALAALLVAGSARGIAGLYPSLADRIQYEATLGGSRASAAFNGRGYDLATTGGITAYEVGVFGQLVFPLLGLLLGIHLTRREEEAGRWDIVTAGRVSPGAPLTAAAALCLGSAALTTALTAAGALAAGLPARGAVWYALGIGALIAAFAGVGLLAGQVAASTRTAWAIGGAAQALFFLVRAVVDGRNLGAVWLSPLGWAAEVRPFGDGPRWWPILAYAVSCAACLGAAAWVAHHRDLGSGAIVPRPGPARGAPRLGTAAGVAWRLGGGALIGWALGAAAWAATFGALSEEMTGLIEANPALMDAMGLTRATDVVASMALLVVALAAMGAGVQCLVRLGSEEEVGRLATLVATRRPRAAVWRGWLCVAFAQALVVLAAGALALGVTTWAATGRVEDLRVAAWTGAAYAVPVLLVVSVAAVLAGWRPGWARIVWSVVGWAAVVGLLGETLRLPDWARNTSPLRAVGNLPVDDPDAWVLVGMAVIAAVLVLASQAAFTRRDVLG